MVHPVLKAGNTAVITGAGAGGIGYSVARILASRFGMRVMLADNSKEALEQAEKDLVRDSVPQENILSHVVDVSDADEMFSFADVAFDKLGGKVDFLHLNAGTSTSTKSLGGKDELAKWNKILSVNLGGVLNGTQAFVDRMVGQGSPAAVVCTGSKQGFTLPPGNPAYNTSKAAVNALAQSLANSLIGTQVTAHLLVPGYTHTKLTTKDGIVKSDEKPAAAWTADQVAEELFKRIENEFYIICPDNDVSWELDQARMQYNLDDILKGRPALSRWHPEHKDAFAAYIEKNVPKRQAGGRTTMHNCS